MKHIILGLFCLGAQK